MSGNTLLQLDLPGVSKVRSGKVREMFDLGDRILMVASDRISAYDVVMPNGIPRKGEVLTMFSHFWFGQFADIVPNHLLAGADEPLPEAVRDFAEQIGRRAMVVKKAQPLAIECVVRGYLAGSGWKEYQKQKTVCGIELPDGLENSSQLPEPIFTPATKAELGDHDENVSYDAVVATIGADDAATLRDLTLQVYARAEPLARERGILLADTKLEFGVSTGSTNTGPWQTREPEEPLEGSVAQQIDQLLTRAEAAFEAADQALADGDLAEYQTQVERAQELIGRALELRN